MEYAPANAKYVTMELDPTLTNERVVQAGPGMMITDEGADQHVVFTSFLPYVEDASLEVNFFKVELDPAPDSYYTGLAFSMKAANTDTGPSALGIGILGLKPLKKTNGQDLAAGDIEEDQVVVVLYDGTNFVLISEVATAPAPAAHAATHAAGGSDPVSHNTLPNLQGGDTGDYQHLTTAQVAALHVAATVSGPPLTIAGQALTFNYDTSDFQLSGNNLQVKDSGISHGAISGLGNDDHTQYLLLSGRSGGQLVHGGSGSGENLTLHSTYHATKGKIYFGSNNVYDEANDLFGIGNTSPDIKFDVYNGNVRIMGKDGFDTAGDKAILFLGNKGAGDTGAAGIMAQYAYGVKICVYKSGGNGALGTNSLDALNIAEVSGFTGIGQATPQEMLDVNGAIRLGNSTNTNNGTIRWTGTDFEGRKGGAWVSMTSGGSSPGGANTNVQFNNSGAFGGDSNFVWDNTNKRLGIGTSSPGKLLEIYNTASEKFWINGGTSQNGMTFCVAGGGKAWYLYSFNNGWAIYNNTDGNQPFTILNGGNIGVGQTSPVEKLDVNGAIRIGNAVATNNGTIRWTGTDFEGRKGGAWVSMTGGGSAPGGANTNVQFNNSGAFGGDSNFVWDNTNKRLGIGCTPAHRLHINLGTGTATEDKMIILGRSSTYGILQIGNDNADESSMTFIGKVSAFGTSPTSTDGDSHIWPMGCGGYSIGGENFYLANKSFNNPIITITYTGNVGIGKTTTMSGHRLSVKGGTGPHFKVAGTGGVSTWIGCVQGFDDPMICFGDSGGGTECNNPSDIRYGFSHSTVAGGDYGFCRKHNSASWSEVYRIERNGGRVALATTSYTEKLGIGGAICIGAATGTTDGTIQWTGTDFQGRKGGAWVSLTGTPSMWTTDGSGYLKPLNAESINIYSDTSSRPQLRLFDSHTYAQYCGPAVEFYFHRDSSQTYRKGAKISSEKVTGDDSSMTTELVLYSGYGDTFVEALRLKRDSTQITWSNSTSYENIWARNMIIADDSSARQHLILRDTKTGYAQGNGPEISFDAYYAASNHGEVARIESYKSNGTDGDEKFDLIFYNRANYSLNERMRILHDGKTGIGTSTPGAKLDALDASGAQLRLSYSNNSVYTSFTVDSSGILWVSPNHSTLGYIRFKAVHDNLNFFSVQSSDATDVLSVDTSNKRVGVGNYNSPHNALSVYGAMNATAAVLVGITAPDADYALQVVNNSSFKCKGYVWDTYSDQRIKSEIRDMEYGLNTILSLKPKRYNQHDSELYTDSEIEATEEKSKKAKKGTGSRHKILESKKDTIGLISQDVIEIIPEAVSKPGDENSELWGMDYTKIIPVLVKAIQELSEKVTTLEKQIKTK